MFNRLHKLAFVSLAVVFYFGGAPFLASAHEYNYNLPPEFIGQIFNPSANAIIAGFYKPIALAIGPDGLYYSIADGNQMVQKFDSFGNVLAFWGGIGTGDGQFDYATAIAVNSINEVYVVDAAQSIVQKFDADGNFLAKWGSSGIDDGQFDWPQNMAIDGSDNVYVVDQSNNRVQKFDADGNFLAKWGSFGTGDGQLSWPAGIAFDSSGNIYIADWNNNRVQKFDADGNFLAKWGSFGTGDGQVNGPSAIAINSHGESFVIDQRNVRIVKFDASGNFVMNWGSQGLANGQFSTFTSTDCISVDANDNVYVVDIYSSRVQIFDANGQYINQIGSSGYGSGQFAGVGAVAFDPSGNIYGVDKYNHRIQKFDANGNFILEFGSYGTGNGQMKYPMGITINDSGEVYVTEAGNQRVQKFDSNGNFLAKWGSFGSSDGQFSNPIQINLDAAGNVYVGDSNNYRIQKFDASGNFIAKYGTHGSGDGQFGGGVDGVAFDSQGNMYTGEFEYCRIQKFDANRNFLAKWGSCGTGNGQFNEPIQIAVAPHDLIYVVEGPNNRVQVFDSNGNWLATWGGYGNSHGQFIYPHGIAINGQGKIIIGDMNNKIQMFEYGWGPFAPAPWTINPGAIDAVFRGDNITFDITTTMQETNPQTAEANQMQIVLDTGIKVPLAYSSINVDGDTVWTGTYAVPADMAVGTHRYTVQANAALVKTDTAVAFDAPATGTDNTGLTTAGSFKVMGRGGSSASSSQFLSDNITSNIIAPEQGPGTGQAPAVDNTTTGTYTPFVALGNTPDINTDKGLAAPTASASGGNNQQPITVLCASGSLIKGSLPAVYYCGADEKRYVFVNDKAFFSWYSDFSTVITVSDADLALIPIGGNITYRPGSRMVKIMTDPKVYAVSRGGTLRWIATEAVAIRLYGADWNTMIDDIPDAFLVNYTIGEAITE